MPENESMNLDIGVNTSVNTKPIVELNTLINKFNKNIIKATESMNSFSDSMDTKFQSLVGLMQSIEKSSGNISKIRLPASEIDVLTEKERTKQSRAETKTAKINAQTVQIVQNNETERTRIENNRRSRESDNSVIRSENKRAIQLSKERTWAEYNDQRAELYKQPGYKAALVEEKKLLNEKRKLQIEEAKAAQTSRKRAEVGKTVYNIGSKISQAGRNDKTKFGSFVGESIEVAGAFIKNPATGFAVIITKAGKAVAEFSQSVVDSYKEIESLKVQLEVISGSKTEANKTFDEISDYAVKSPFGVQQTTQMAVLLKQSGVYSSDLMDSLKMIGDTAGGSMEKMQRIANNYAQIAAQGRATAMDMRQFAMAGIPIYKELSKEMGIQQSTLRKMVSEGKIGYEEIEKIFRKMTSQGGQFYQSVNKGADTLKARVQNLEDKKTLAKANIGEAVLSDGNIISASYKGFISIQEDIFNFLNNWTEIQNIERDISVMSDREGRIETLEKEIREAKDNGDEFTAAIKTMQLKELDPKSTVAILNSAYYKNYMRKTQGERDFKKLTAESPIIEDVYNKIYREYPRVASEARSYLDENKFVSLDKNEDAYTFVDVGYRKLDATEEEELLKKFDKLAEIFEKGYYKDVMDKADYANEYKNLKSVGAALRFIDLVTERPELLVGNEVGDIFKRKRESEIPSYEELQAFQKQSAKDFIQIGLDANDKKASSKSSLSSNISKYEEAYKQSDKYKDEELKKSKSDFRTLKKLTNELKPFLNKDNIFEISMYTDKNLNLLKRELSAGMLSIDDTFKFTEDDWGDAKNAKELAKQDREYANKMMDTAYQYMTYLEKNDKEIKSTLSNARDSETWNDVKKLLTDPGKSRLGNSSYKVIEDISAIKTVYDLASPAMQELLKNNVMPLLSGRLIGNTELEGINEEDIFNNNEIPLWKRILGSGLGLEPSKIIGYSKAVGNKAVETHYTEQYGRSIVSSVLKEMASGRLIKGLSLIQYKSGAWKDKDQTYGSKIDWDETKKSFAEYVRSPESSVAEMEAYRNSIENEKNILETTISSLLQGDNQAKSLNEEFINVFDGRLKDTSGRFFRRMSDGLMHQVDGNNNVIDGGLVKTFEELKNELSPMEDVLESLNERLKETNESLRDTGFIYGRKKFSEDIQNSSEESLAISRVMKLPISNNLSLSLAQKQAEMLLDSYKASNKDEISKNGFSADRFIEYVKFGAGLRNPYTTSYSDALSDWAIESSNIHRAEKRIEDNNNIIADLRDVIHNNKQYSDNPMIAETLLEFENSINNINKENERLRESIESRTPILQQKESVYKTEKEKYDSEQDKLRKKREEQDKENYNLQLSDYNSLTEQDLRYLRTNFKTDNKLQWTAGRIPTNSTSIWESLKIAGSKSVADAAGLPDSVNPFALGEKDIDLSIKLKVGKEVTEFFNKVDELGKETLKKSFTAPFEQIGKSLATSEDYGSNLADSMKEIGRNAAMSLAELVKETGFHIASAGAVEVAKGNSAAGWGMVAAGLAMAGAGGVAAGFFGASKSDDNDDDKASEEYERLQDMKNQLADLLEQARKDAIYYETAFRHSKAISTNEYFSNASVNDAIITPNGNIISTHPDDYLIATKTPETLMTRSVAPNVSFKISNNGNPVTISSSQTRTDSNGNVEIMAVIENIVKTKTGEYIASSESDNAFAARNYRLNGYSVVS